MLQGKYIDKYTATWVSHSSMGDFIKCPRAYYLHNVYKDPKTRRKINLVSPALSLGVAVHEVLEGLAAYKVRERADKLTLSELEKDFERAWAKVTGIRGGFEKPTYEKTEKERAWNMLRRVAQNPEPLLEKTVKVKEGDNGLPPHFLLSEEDNIILCGKVDWLQYVPTDDSVHILDFKTGRHEESEGSLQLPIYQLILKQIQRRKVSGASYWYIDKEDRPIEVELPGLQESYDKVIAVAKKVKQARDEATIQGADAVFLCHRGEGGCFSCRPFESILKGEAHYVGVGDMRQDLYCLKEKIS